MLTNRSDEDVKKDLYAVLFSVGKVISLEELSRVVKETDLDRLKNLLSALRIECDAQAGPLVLIQEGDNYKLTVRSKFMDVVQKVVKQTELPKSVLETLAVIAYKAPVMQSDVIKIRTNKAYNHLDQLEELDYLTRERKGRSKLIRLTPKFYDYFEISPEQLQKKFLDKKIKEEGEQQLKLALIPTDTTEVVQENQAEPGSVEIYQDASKTTTETKRDDNSDESDSTLTPLVSSSEDNPVVSEEPRQEISQPTGEFIDDTPKTDTPVVEPAQTDLTSKTPKKKKQPKELIHESDPPSVTRKETDEAETSESTTYEPPRVSGGFKNFSKQEKKQIKEEVDEIIEGEKEE